MDLWIRSQDKERLFKINGIYLESEKDKHYIMGFSDDYCWLGNYKTKERALEVLDEIQNILKPKILAHIRPSEETEELLGGLRIGKTMKMKKEFEFKELSTYVYEMPKE